MHEDGTYSRYKWYNFHFSYYKQLNKDMLLDIKSLIPQFSTDKECKSKCMCSDKTRKATDEEKAAALNSNHDSLDTVISEISSFKRKEKRVIEKFDMSEIHFDKEDSAEKIGNEITKLAMSGLGKIATKAQTLTLWDVVKLVLMVIQMKLL